jgi:hypothetical protein
MAKIRPIWSHCWQSMNCSTFSKGYFGQFMAKNICKTITLTTAFNIDPKTNQTFINSALRAKGPILQLGTAFTTTLALYLARVF